MTVSFLGSTVRQRAVNHLRKKFNTLEDAENEYGLLVDSYLGVTALPSSDDELENVEPDMIQKLTFLSVKQWSASHLPRSLKTKYWNC